MTITLTVADASRLLGVSGHRVRALIREGRIDAARVSRRGDYRISPDSLRRHLAERALKATRCSGPRTLLRDAESAAARLREAARAPDRQRFDDLLGELEAILRQLGEQLPADSRWRAPGRDSP